MNTFPTWGHEYAIGNMLLDKQHKRLMEIGGRGAEILAASPFPAIDFQALVSDYILTLQQHFDDEEKALASNGYPDLAAHRAEHAAFSGALGEILCQAKHGEADAKALLRLIERYICIHLQADLACKDYLKDR